MRARPTTSLVLRWLLLAASPLGLGCRPPDPLPAADAALDAAEVTADDASPDLPTLDASPDRFTPDAAPDAARDAAPDATPDATPDAAPDAARDAAPDATPDAAPDAAPDATPDATPGADVLRPVFPLSGLRAMSRRPTLQWALAAGETGACVERCADPACATVTATTPVTGTSLTLPTQPDGTLWWRLRPLSAGVCGARSGPVWSLRITAHDAPLATAWGLGWDVDFDGYDDVVLPAAGGTRVIYGGRSTSTSGRLPGRAAPLWDVQGDGRVDWLVDNGVHAGTALGYAPSPLVTLRSDAFFLALEGVGDVNGDGYGDLVGSHLGSPPAGEIEGWYGAAAGPSATASWSASRILFAYFSDILGVTSLGDLNGDRFADFSASGTNTTGGLGGAAQFLGGPTTPSSRTTTCMHGGSLSLAGDLNGDGRADAIARCAGGSDGPMPYNAILLSAATGLEARVPYYASTEALSRAGDLDGDGFDDLLHTVGATRRVLRGGASGLTPSTATFAPNAFAAGDVNGDGFDDLAESNGTSVQLFFGSAAGVSASAARTVTLP